MNRTRTVPAPPVERRSKRQTRYPISTVMLARQLANAGWLPSEIGDLLERETGHRPSTSTLYYWTNPGAAERYRKSRAVNRPEPREFDDKVLLELREDGLTMNSIAIVVRRFYGVELTEGQVRYRLDQLGAPKNPNKARIRHEQIRREREKAA